MPESPFKTLAWTLALVWVGGPAQAFEFGTASTTAVLGAPLAFEVELRRMPGDEADPRCVAADVAMGGVTVPPRGVSVGLRGSDAGLSVRVRTVAAVHDPVVGVVVSVGCPARLTRRFTVLADPPAAGWAAQPAPLPLRQDEAGPLLRVPQSGSHDRPGIEPSASAGHSVPPSVRATGQASDARAVTPAIAQAVGDSRSRLEVAAPMLRGSRGESAPASAPSEGSAPAPGPARASVPTVGSSAPAVVSNSPGTGSDAATPNSDTTAVALARVQSLENTLLALRIESRQQRDALTRLEAALREAESRSHLAWMTTALLAVALAVVVALGLRRSRSTSRAGPHWKLSWSSHAAPAPMEPVLGAVEPASRGTAARAVQADLTGVPVQPGRDEVPDHSARPAGTAPDARVGGSVPPSEVGNGENAMERTRLMPPSAASVSEPLHAVPAEEVLDLEQQVEFLTVLGREDSAVELLIEHLRKTGGTHPTPFLKLMELHRRRGEREAYEGLRARFNQRFNAVAAAFGAVAAPQRTLQDCPELMRSIEHAWPRPLDAMTLLENLMFRSVAKEPLDMATLEEVVFLHALARDLDQRSVRSSSPVDVLLPLDEPLPGTSRAAADGNAGTDMPPLSVYARAGSTAGGGGATTEGDPWSSISEADFNVGGLAMEPLTPLPGASSPHRKAG